MVAACIKERKDREKRQFLRNATFFSVEQFFQLQSCKCFFAEFFLKFMQRICTSQSWKVFDLFKNYVPIRMFFLQLQIKDFPAARLPSSVISKLCYELLNDEKDETILCFFWYYIKQNFGIDKRGALQILLLLLRQLLCRHATRYRIIFDFVNWKKLWLFLYSSFRT